MQGRILYQVVISVAPEIRDAYLAWLRPHMEKMLGIDGFLAAEFFFNAENENEITCLYRLRDRAAMDAYLAGPANAMRADGTARFGGKMQVKRKILERIPKSGNRFSDKMRGKTKI